jgi:hypothetical protein
MFATLAENLNAGLIVLEIFIIVAGATFAVAKIQSTTKALGTEIRLLRKDVKKLDGTLDDVKLEMVRFSGRLDDHERRLTKLEK